MGEEDAVPDLSWSVLSSATLETSIQRLPCQLSSVDPAIPYSLCEMPMRIGGKYIPPLERYHRRGHVGRISRTDKRPFQRSHGMIVPVIVAARRNAARHILRTLSLNSPTKRAH